LIHTETVKTNFAKLDEFFSTNNIQTQKLLGTTFLCYYLYWI